MKGNNNRMYNKDNEFKSRDLIDFYRLSNKICYNHQKLDFYNSTIYDNITNYNYEENSSMSIIHAAILKDGIVMASDSRSSKKINNVWSFNDSYNKLYYFSDIGLGVVSAGLNEFRNKTFTDLCIDVQTLYQSQPSDRNKMIDFVIETLNNALSFYNQLTGVDCQIIYGFTLDITIACKHESIPKLMSYSFSVKDGIRNDQIITTGKSITFGIPWMQKYFVDSIIENDTSAIDYKKKAEEIIQGLIVFSNKIDDPSFVGGKVSSILIK